MLTEHLKENNELNFKEKLGEKVLEFNLLEELKFDAETLNLDITEHTQKVALLVELLDRKKHTLEKLEIEFGGWKNNTWCHIKENESDTAGKAYSDARVTMMVEGNDEYLKYENAIADLKQKVRRLTNAVERFKDRKDLLQTFAGNLRSNH